MKIIFSFILVLFFCGNSAAQGQAVLKRMKKLHELMVTDRFYVDQYVDDSLTYGHSNGWVESRKEFYENLGSRLVYHSITEDSVEVKVNGNYAQVRFNGDFDVTMGGHRAVYKLKVLEVWVRKNKKDDWDLFARQAVRRQ